MPKYEKKYVSLQVDSFTRGFLSDVTDSNLQELTFVIEKK